MLHIQHNPGPLIGAGGFHIRGSKCSPDTAFYKLGLAFWKSSPKLREIGLVPEVPTGGGVGKAMRFLATNMSHPFSATPNFPGQYKIGPPSKEQPLGTFFEVMAVEESKSDGTGGKR